MFRDSGTYILSGIDDVQILLDDHILKTTTMKTSPFAKPFETNILYFISFRLSNSIIR